LHAHLLDTLGFPSPPQTPSRPRSNYITPLISTPPPAHPFIPPTNPVDIRALTHLFLLSSSFPFPPSSNTASQPPHLSSFSNLLISTTPANKNPLKHPLSLLSLPTNENHSTRPSLTTPFPSPSMEHDISLLSRDGEAEVVGSQEQPCTASVVPQLLLTAPLSRRWAGRRSGAGLFIFAAQREIKSNAHSILILVG
jgi:hypothetical protein